MVATLVELRVEPVAVVKVATSPAPAVVAVEAVAVPEAVASRPAAPLPVVQPAEAVDWQYRQCSARLSVILLDQCCAAARPLPSSR